MAGTNRVFARNVSGEPIGGFTQATNNQSLYWTEGTNQGVPDLNEYFPSSNPDVSACVGPDEGKNYVIAYENPEGRPATSKGDASATYPTTYIGFRGSLTSAGFEPLAQLVFDVTKAEEPPADLDAARDMVVNAGMYASW